MKSKLKNIINVLNITGYMFYMIVTLVAQLLFCIFVVLFVISAPSILSWLMMYPFGQNMSIPLILLFLGILFYHSIPKR
jgi:hypothetical protein